MSDHSNGRPEAYCFKPPPTCISQETAKDWKRVRQKAEQRRQSCCCLETLAKGAWCELGARRRSPGTVAALGQRTLDEIGEGTLT